MVDVIVIGGGTAGLTSAIYIQRSALQCVVFEAEEFGGRIFPTLGIDNYPAMPGVSGYDYSEKLREQARELGAELLTQTVIKIMRNGEMWHIITRDNESPAIDNEYMAKAIIYAAGEKHRQLNVPGEDEFFGRGVATCAACDAALYRNKNVAIVGGGDKALDDALTLARFCDEVHLIHRREEFRAAGGTTAQVKGTPNIKLHLNRVASSINGTRRVEGISLHQAEGASPRQAEGISTSRLGGVDAEDGRDIETIAVSGVFIAIGSIPQTELCSEFVQLNEQGYVVAGEDCTTQSPGFFVAGDVRLKPLRQLVTAAADGAVAAKAAADYITLY